MSLLASWTWSRTARAVSEALIEAGADPAAPLAVIELPALARLLPAGRSAPLVVSERGRGLKRVRPLGVRARAAALPFADGALGALVAAGAGDASAWEPLLGEFGRVVRDGGAVVLVDRAPREELMRRTLCAGLVELAQRSAGRHVVTSGRVRKI